jgi:hypothetical protein
MESCKKKEAARVKKVKAQAKRDAIMAARVEEARKVEAARVEAGEEAVAPRLNCCLKRVLSNEPDFLEQKDWLTTIVEAVGFTIMFFPKYHCVSRYVLTHTYRDIILHAHDSHVA